MKESVNKKEAINKVVFLLDLMGSSNKQEIREEVFRDLHSEVSYQIQTNPTLFKGIATLIIYILQFALKNVDGKNEIRKPRWYDFFLDREWRTFAFDIINMVLAIFGISKK